MKRTTIVAAAVILVLGIGLILGLSKYKLPLIHSILENAVIQKAPANYPQARIRQAFDRNLQEARRTDREERYLNRLLQASQRLEKVQKLDSPQVDELLMELDPAQAAR